MSTQRKIWFITGASAGFGLTMTEYVLAQGHIAVATLRKPEVLAHLTEKYPADQLLLLKVDVSKKTDVVEAFAAVKEKFGRIDVVFNNAGYAFVAEVEDDVDGKARAVFDVNFWGATNVLRESVKFLRDVNEPRGGRIVTTSAIVGTTGHPSMGYYGATKHALEGIIKALSNEVLPEWNIKFNIIESGGFSTRIASPASYVMQPTLAAYKGGPSEVLRYYLENVDKMPVAGDPREAIRGIYAAASDEDAPLRIPLGVDALRAVKAELEAHLAEVEKSRKYSESFKYEEGGNPFLKAAQ